MIGTDGRTIEEEVLRVLKALGFNAEATRATADGGIDIVATRPDPLLTGKYIIQCKNWSGPVGEPVVRDLFGVVTAERANKGILITTSRFTASAVAFAAGKPLELIDGPRWQELCEEAGISVLAPGGELQYTGDAQHVLNLTDQFLDRVHAIQKELGPLACDPATVPILDEDVFEILDLATRKIEERAPDIVPLLRDSWELYLKQFGPIIDRTLIEDSLYLVFYREFVGQTAEETDEWIEQIYALLARFADSLQDIGSRALDKPDLFSWFYDRMVEALQKGKNLYADFAKVPPPSGREIAHGYLLHALHTQALMVLNAVFGWVAALRAGKPPMLELDFTPVSNLIVQALEASPDEWTPSSTLWRTLAGKMSLLTPDADVIRNYGTVVVRCSSCRTINPMSADQCRICGKDLSKEPTIKNPYV